MNEKLIKFGLILLCLVCFSSVVIAEDKPKEAKPAETPAESTVPSDCHGA